MRKLLLVLLLLSINISVQAIHIAIDPDASRLDQLIVHGQSILGDQWSIILSHGDEVYGYVAWYDGGNTIITTEVKRFATIQEQNDYFYYDENMMPYFDNILQNYTPYDLLDTCANDDLTLHQFTGYSAGIPYDINIFHRPIGSKIIRTVGFYFPDNRSEEMYDYMRRFYPNLLSCSDEDGN